MVRTHCNVSFTTEQGVMTYYDLNLNLWVFHNLQKMYLSEYARLLIFVLFLLEVSSPYNLR